MDITQADYTLATWATRRIRANSLDRDSDDLIQEAVIRLWEAGGDYDEPQRAVIAIRGAVQFNRNFRDARKRYRMKRVPLEEANEMDLLIDPCSPDIMAQLEQAVETVTDLPPRTQELVSLLTKGYNLTECAEILGFNQSRASHHKKRLTDHIREVA